MIPIADGLSLPLNAVTQKFAFLARSGAGKTYGASKLAEGMLGAKAQVVVLDPVGVWWGLRLAADGKSRGLDVPVFGGLHGDIPLEPTAGALVADLVVDRALSVVLDVSMFRKGDRKRFVTDFAEQLFHRKKGQRSPVHLFVEEAQVFVPQRTQHGEERMLGAFEDIIKQGRNFGVGVTLISQRPQAVNKDVLNQTEALFVLQTTGAQERKALSEWIVEQGLDAKQLVGELPALPIGTAYLWSPQWLKKLEKVRILKKDTFNASATPEVGHRASEPKPLEPMELNQVREAMAATIKRAEAEDPKALQRKVAELQGKLAKAEAEKNHHAKSAMDQWLKADHVRELQRVVDKFAEGLEQIKPVAAELVAAMRATRHGGAAPRLPVVTVRAEPRAARVAHDVERVHTGRERTQSGDDRLPKGARDMLTALASTLLPSLTRNQVAMLAGLKVTGGTFQKYLSILRTGGYLEADRESNLAITETGLSAIGGRPPAPATHQELLALWNAKLPAGARDMLAALVRTRPDGCSREQLADEVSMEVRGGTFQKYLSILRTNGLVEVRDGELVASESLFLGGAP